MLGSSGTDSSNEPGQPTLGCSTHSRELLKIGIAVSQATVAKYMARNRKPPSQTWRTFLQNHAKNLVPADFFEATEAGYRESCDPDQRAYNHGVDSMKKMFGTKETRKNVGQKPMEGNPGSKAS